MPPWQTLEQHSPPVVHALPEVLQLPLSGAHFWPTHDCPQHSAFCVQARLSPVHLAVHFPPAQPSEQQSVPVVHVSFTGLQLAIGAPHTPS